MGAVVKKLTKDEILGVHDTQVRQVLAPEWGGVVYVRTLNGTERDAFDMAFRSGSSLSNFRAVFASQVLCDESGLRLFDETDAVELGKKNSVVLDRIFDAGMALNKLNAEGVDKAEKNSESGQSDNSGSH